MNKIRTISIANLTLQIISLTISASVFLFFSIVTFQIDKLACVVSSILSVLALILLVRSVWQRVYKLEFGENIILSSLCKKTIIDFKDVLSISSKTIRCHSKKISFWYPVYGKYAVGSDVDNYQLILNHIKTKNHHVIEVAPSGKDTKLYLTAAVLSIVSTAAIVFSGILNSLDDGSIKTLFVVYLGNVLSIALILYSVKKLSKKHKEMDVATRVP